MPDASENQSVATRFNRGFGTRCLQSPAVWTMVAMVFGGFMASVVAEDRIGQDATTRLRANEGQQGSGAIHSRSSSAQEGPLVREGEIWENELGHILLAGQRYAFRPIQGGRSVIVLENLNLQRIIQRLEESSQPTIWSISGRVTEFQGGNYLLIERAMRKGQASLQAAGQR